MNRKLTLSNERDMCRFMTDLHERLIIDVAAQYGSAVKQESLRDIAVMRRRVASEGLSFLTKALPKLAKELDRALSQGVQFAPLGFKKKPNSTLPKFLGYMFELVFDPSGYELANSCPRAVRDLRQVLYLMYKLAVPHTQDQEEETLLGFAEVDAGLPTSIAEDDVIRHARNFITNVFGSFDPYDIVPKHGPGAVATGEKNHEKHRFSRLYKSIERVYPFTEYFIYNLTHHVDDPTYLRKLEVLEDGTAKVVLVPKDSRGPRIISCEPLEYQWMQGGLGSKISSHLEKCRWTKGHVNFTDQTINQRFALRGSKGPKWVTLDMKEASDRVSVALVSVLFRDCPALLDCLLALRTPRTRLPNGDVVTMKKFAPMGSSLCFPIESIVFMALGVGVILHERSKNANQGKPENAWMLYQHRMQSAARRLFVYGDDIIARSEDYAALLQYFPNVGLKFNADKCCTKGSFRESCGVDAYKGVDVTPLRIKRMWIPGRRQANETYLSFVSFSNEAHYRCLHQVASLVSDAVEEDLGILPTLWKEPETASLDHTRSSLLCWVRPDSEACVNDKIRWKFRFNRDLQRLEVNVHQAVARRVFARADDWSMVLRRHTTPTKLRDPLVFTLTRSVTLKRVWLPY
jgi:hypothetical protein